MGSIRFADVANLESWLKVRRARVKALDSCETVPTPVLLAAVERFYPSQAEALELRTLGASDGDCASAARWIPYSMYLETDASGRSIIP